MTQRGGSVAWLRRTVISRLSLADNGMANRTFPLHKIGISCDEKTGMSRSRLRIMRRNATRAVRPSPAAPF
jgi:hypothetical protein